nr:MAG TPA: hypothetical protein [Caudoviricetes sp.]
MTAFLCRSVNHLVTLYVVIYYITTLYIVQREQKNAPPDGRAMNCRFKIPM